MVIWNYLLFLTACAEIPYIDYFGAVFGLPPPPPTTTTHCHGDNAVHSRRLDACLWLDRPVYRCYSLMKSMIQLTDASRFDIIWDEISGTCCEAGSSNTPEWTPVFTSDAEMITILNKLCGSHTGHVFVPDGQTASHPAIIARIEQTQ